MQWNSKRIQLFAVCSTTVLQCHWVNSFFSLARFTLRNLHEFFPSASKYPICKTVKNGPDTKCVQPIIALISIECLYLPHQEHFRRGTERLGMEFTTTASLTSAKRPPSQTTWTASEPKHLRRTDQTLPLFCPPEPH